MGEMRHESTTVSLPNSEQFYLQSEQDERFLIQVSWPLSWQGECASFEESLPIMFVSWK